MFYIHGGGYLEGSGNDFMYGPDFMVENQVILVTINYRLGVLGFLSLGLPEYSGNMGLKDQQMSLKWVYDNIEAFGGDNSRITVFGESAGKSTFMKCDPNFTNKSIQLFSIIRFTVGVSK